MQTKSPTVETETSLCPIHGGISCLLYPLQSDGREHLTEDEVHDLHEADKTRDRISLNVQRRILDLIHEV